MSCYVYDGIHQYCKIGVCQRMRTETEKLRKDEYEIYVAWWVSDSFYFWLSEMSMQKMSSFKFGQRFQKEAQVT